MVATQADEPGMIASLMDDNPLALVAGGGVLAALLGFGFYRFSRRSKKDSGETSFLESRLQPDSFFGAVEVSASTPATPAARPLR